MKQGMFMLKTINPMTRKYFSPSLNQGLLNSCDLSSDMPDADRSAVTASNIFAGDAEPYSLNTIPPNVKLFFTKA